MLKISASTVVITFAISLIAVAVIVFTRPTLAERFLMSFASSAQTHYAEQVLRLVVGASLIVLSPFMWQTALFRLFGWAIVVSSAVLIILPWQWHNKLGQRVLPILVRRMRIYGVGMLALGAILLWALLPLFA